ncbi:MAG: energy transducer TonB [Deltaproteobacteria bacterium]|nr:energy transducer TonB [Deltaproteobacteria bacterium]
MPEKKEPPYLIIFLLLSLLLHLGLVYRFRAWQPSDNALEALRQQQKHETPVELIELPPEKKPEEPQTPPPKPSFLADRNQQSKNETKTEESRPQTVVTTPAPAPKPSPKPALQPTRPPAKPAAKPESKSEPQAKPAPIPRPNETATAKPGPSRPIPAEIKPQPEKELFRENVQPAPPETETPPNLKKLFPSFEELTKITEERQHQAAQEGKSQPHLPNRLKTSTEISLNTLDYQFHSYYLALKRKIELVWEYPYKARQTGLQGRLLLRFIINQDGTLADVTILRSSGVELLDHEAVRALHNAAPFPPLPARMHTDHLAVTATFEYLLSYRSVH